jgi:L-fuconolactonase
MNATKPRARHIPIRDDWLALRTESAIDPGRPIIDAHHHLWDKSNARYLLAEINADIASGHNIVATIFAEGKANYRTEGDPALQSLGETQLAAAIAAESERQAGGRPHVAAGIIGFVDLILGERAGEVLDLHIEAAFGRFGGVRNTSAWHEDPEARGSVLSPPPGLLYD